MATVQRYGCCDYLFVCSVAAMSEGNEMVLTMCPFVSSCTIADSYCVWLQEEGDGGMVLPPWLVRMMSSPKAKNTAGVDDATNGSHVTYHIGTYSCCCWCCYPRIYLSIYLPKACHQSLFVALLETWPSSRPAIVLKYCQVRVSEKIDHVGRMLFVS